MLAQTETRSSMQRDSGDLFNVCLAAHVKRVVVTVSRIVYMAKLLRHHVFVLELFVAFEDVAQHASAECSSVTRE